MFKKASVFVIIFLSALCLSYGENLGGVSIEEGMPLPFNQGVTWDYGDSGFVQIFIYKGNFVLVFLDSQKKVRISDDVDLATLLTRSVQGNGNVHPFHLTPTEGGLYFTNPRHVFEPYLYNIELSLRKQVHNFPTYTYRKDRTATRPIKISFEPQLLDQRKIELSPMARSAPRRPASN